MNKENRIATLDIAKGIGIILVVVGHCYAKPTNLHRLIYAFHMPFFFIISGIIYSFRDKKFSFNFRTKLKSLLFPYFMFELMWIIFLGVLNFKNPGFNIYNKILNTLLFKGNIATWYLPCLFITEFLFYITLETKYPKLLIFMMLFTGLLYPNQSNKLWFIMRPLVGLGFFSVGYFYNQAFKKRVNCVLYIILLLIYCITALCNGDVSLYSRDFSNIVLYIFNGILGSFLVLYFCKFIEKQSENSQILTIFKSRLCYFGEHSLVIMCIHPFFIEIFRLLEYKILGGLLPLLGEVEVFLCAFIVIICCLLFIPFWNRYLGFLLGKRKI